MRKDEIEGVENEVITYDCYKMKHLDFVPDVIFDIGSNVGVFAKMARQMFHDALIVAVEPDKTNVAQHKMIGAERFIMVHKAIGHGKVYRSNHENNPELGGAQECYHTEMMGYPKETFKNEELTIPVSVESVTLVELTNKYLSFGDKFMLKIDCEGGENAIFDHEPSVKALKMADYITAEIHNYSSSHVGNQIVKEHIDKILKELEETHNCERDGIMFYARRR
jgi:FkbM family methyltransferase